jgi:CheY-like chemotaxis protein
MLKSLGYAVLSAQTPGQAIRLHEKNIGKIDLLVTDVVMPEMNGRELSDRLKKQYPKLKTLYMSGYTADVIAHRGVLDKGVCFIPKPLSQKELAVKVREALEHTDG